MKKMLVLALVLCSCIVVLALVQPAHSDPSECLWISFDGTPDSTLTDVEVIESNPSQTILRVVVHGMCVEDTVIGAETFHFITVPGMTTTYEFGKPELPAVSELIALSTDADLVTVTNLSASVADTFKSYNVFPLQQDGVCGGAPDFYIDSTFYSENDAYYPPALAEGDSTGKWHVLPVGHVYAYPFRFNPVSGLLIAYDTLYVTLGHAGSAVTDTIPRSYNTMYGTLVNYQTISGNLVVDTTTYSPHKLFIVADTLIDDPNLGRLIQHEKKKGFRIKKMKVTDAGGSPPTAFLIRHTIWQFYTDSIGSNPFYVVLVGDHDHVPATVDTFGIPAVSGRDPDILSDEWYELMGPLLGYGGDFIPDLMLGRLPTDDSDTLGIMIDVKIKNDTTASANITKELMAADDDKEFGKFDPGDGLKRAFYMYRENKKLVNWVAQTIGFQTTQVYGSDGGTNAMVKTAIEAGLGYVNYRGHGTATTWQTWDNTATDWTKQDVSNLTITDTEPIVWSISCSNNAIDHTGDCIGEEWVKKGKAVAHFGSSRSAPNVKNNYFDLYIHDALGVFASKNENTDLGHIINLAKAYMAGVFNPRTKLGTPGGSPNLGDEAKMIILQYLLLGDPEQTVWTEPASPSLVYHKNGYFTGSDELWVTVESEGDPVEGAVVCVLKNATNGLVEEVFEAKYTDGLGQASFNINPQTPGTMHITVWGQNLEFYTAEVPVVARGWREGDGYKMHFPQLPDTLGLDVNFTYPAVLADDWQCSESGPISNIHFWFSARDDWFDPYGDLTSQIANIHVSIHSNIPDPDGAGPFFSMPGETLWTADIAADSFIVSFNPYAGGDPGWYDPTTGVYIPNDHSETYQCNLVGIPNPFVQQQDSIYWLDLSIAPVDLDSMLGWKTADLDRYPPPYDGGHFMDDAVWGVMPVPTWGELKYPVGHPDAGQSLDLAFVVGADTVITGVLDDQGRTPRSYRLGQNYPNPFNPTTTIQYETPGKGHVYLAIYNVKGQRVRTLVNDQTPAGRHKARWNGRDASGTAVASGVYFYYMKAGTFSQARKLVFLK